MLEPQRRTLRTRHTTTPPSTKLTLRNAAQRCATLRNITQHNTTSRPTRHTPCSRHVGRVGSVLVMFCSAVVPFQLHGVSSDCLESFYELNGLFSDELGIKKWCVALRCGCVSPTRPLNLRQPRTSITHFLHLPRLPGLRIHPRLLTLTRSLHPPRPPSPSSTILWQPSVAFRWHPRSISVSVRASLRQ